IEQRDDLIMFVESTPEDRAIVIKTLRDVEQSTATDVILMFVDDFIQASPFVSVVMERLKEEHRMACEGLAEEGRGQLPALPPPLFDLSILPEQRLREAISFARSIVPFEGGHRLVWSVCPSKIVDRR